MTRGFAVFILCLPLYLCADPILISGTDEVKDFQITPGQSHVIIAFPSSVALYDIKKEVLLENQFDPGLILQKILISPDSNKLYFSSADELKVFDIQTAKVKQLLKLTSPISNVMISPLGHLVIGCKDGTLMCLDPKQSYTQVFDLKMGGLVSAIEFDPESSSYLISDLEGSIYKVTESGEISKLLDDRHAIFDLSIQTRGRTFVAATANGAYLFTRRGESFQKFSEQEKHSWISSITDKQNASVFGYGSGLVEVRTSFASYKTNFRCSVVRVEMLDQSIIKVIVQTLNKRLYLAKGVDMKNSLK